MAPRRSNDMAPPASTVKPRAKRPVKCEEAEPTPAQKKRQEIQEVRDKERKRQARYMEKPNEDNFLDKEVLSTQKRSAYPAYDDSPHKRRKYSQGQEKKKLACRAPWEKDLKLKKPLLRPGLPIGTSPREQDPIKTMAKFGDVAVEIRDEILRYLLLWPHDIILFHGWSRIFPRTRPRMNLSVLYTCRVLREQGLRILFGENHFVYDLRDPPAAHGHTVPVLDKVFDGCVVPIIEHGHLIRHVTIRMDRGRIQFPGHCRNFEHALLRFIPGGDLAKAARFHTLTLEIPAETNEDLNPSLEKGNPNEVPICRHLRRGTKLFDALLKLQIQWLRVLARDRSGNRWAATIDMRYYAKDEQMRLEHIALHKDQKHGKADGVSDQSKAGDPAATTSYRTKDVEAMEKLWDRKVKRALTALHSLARRVEELALDPDSAVHDEFWTDVTACHNDRSYRSRNRGESLRPDFRGHSYTRTPLSSRRRAAAAAAACRGSDAEPTKGPTHHQSSKPKRPNANAKAAARAGTATATSRHGADGNLGSREARLLEAQQGVQWRSDVQVGPGEKGMLTEQWLDSLPEHGGDIVDSMEGDEEEEGRGAASPEDELIPTI